MGNLAGWPYWKVVSITGQAGAGTDYQTKITIGDSAGGDVHLEGHCTNFPQDIRITDDDGTTLLDHFVEDITADPIVVHVEVKDDLGSNQTIRVYYGKSGETTASDIETTFLFGDDFNDASIDTSKWYHWHTGGTSVESGGILHLSGTGSFESQGAKTQFTYPVIFEYRAKMNESAEDYIGADHRSNDGAGNNDVLYWRNTGSKIYQSANDGTSTTPARSDAITSYFNLKIEYLSTGSKFYINDILKYTTVSNEPNEALGQTFITKTSGGGVWVDWTFTRKYNSPEPAFSNAGAEQSAAGAPTGIFYGPLVGPFGGPI